MNGSDDSMQPEGTGPLPRVTSITLAQSDPREIYDAIVLNLAKPLRRDHLLPTYDAINGLVAKANIQIAGDRQSVGVLGAGTREEWHDALRALATVFRPNVPLTALGVVGNSPMLGMATAAFQVMNYTGIDEDETTQRLTELREQLEASGDFVRVSVISQEQRHFIQLLADGKPEDVRAQLADRLAVYGVALTLHVCSTTTMEGYVIVV